MVLGEGFPWKYEGKFSEIVVQPFSCLRDVAQHHSLNISLLAYLTSYVSLAMSSTILWIPRCITNQPKIYVSGLPRLSLRSLLGGTRAIVSLLVGALSPVSQPHEVESGLQNQQHRFPSRQRVKTKRAVVVFQPRLLLISTQWLCK